MCYDLHIIGITEKAFDKVPHQRLLFKLKAHGIGDSITDWIEQWLTDRKRYGRCSILGNVNAYIQDMGTWM